jgi:hypothetical protein
VSGPFIFIATNRLKPGKLADEKLRVPGLVDFVQASEPRLIAFNEYVNEDGTEVAVVQVHPDADSMAAHMEIVAERRRPRDVAAPGRGRRSVERQAESPRRIHSVTRKPARDKADGDHRVRAAARTART